jgi:catalase
MQTGTNGGSNPNYRPNSFDDIIIDETKKEKAVQLDSTIADWYDRNEHDDDHYTQPGLLYRDALNVQDRKNLIDNILVSMRGIVGEQKNVIVQRQLYHFCKVNMEFGLAIANGLEVKVEKLESNISEYLK